MALTTVTYQPISCPQVGLWSPAGAATAWQALSDNSTSSYVSLAGGVCQLDSQVCRLGFQVPQIPTGAQVYSVGLRRTVLCAVPPVSVPLCYHWFRSLTGTILVAGQSQQVYRTFFFSKLPTATAAGTWVTESVYTTTIGPDGLPWNPATNLTNFYYDMGRGDNYLNSPIAVAEVYLDVTYQQESAVTIIGPTGVIPDTKPTITWEYSSADSQLQQGYQTAVYTLSQTQAAGFTPFITPPIDGTGGFVLGADLRWTMNIDLTDDNYAAYAQAESQWAGPGEFYSAIGSTTWTRSATGQPAAAVLESASFDSTNNRVALTFAPGSSSPVTTSFTVYASRDGGQSWGPIPRLTYVPAQGMNAITEYDYIAALNQPSQYYVLAYGGSPLQAAAAPSSTLSVTPTGDRHWLKHPSNPLLNTVLPVASPKQSENGIKITKRRMQGTFQLLGLSGSEVLPFIVSGPTYGNEYEIELIFVEEDPNTPMTLWVPVDELDRSGGTLLWQQPDGTQSWVVTGPGASGQDTEETYMPVAGSPTTVFWRRRKLTLTQVQAPAFY